MVGPSKVRGLLNAFGGRGFTIFWIGGTLMTTGRWVLNVVASIHIYELTGSPFWVGMVNVATFAPIFVVSMYGGVLSDRFSRRRLVMVIYSAAAVVALALAGVTFAGRTTAAVLVTASLVVGITNALSKPSLSSLIAALVPMKDISRASAVNTLQFFVGQVTGSALASVLLIVSSPAVAFTVAAVLLMGQVVVMPALRPMPRRAEDRIERASAREVVEGLRFVWRNGAMVAVLGTVVIANGMGEAVRTLSPGFAVDALGVRETAAGILITALSLGSAIGSVAFAQLAKVVGEGRLLRIGFVAQGLACLLLAAAPTLAVAIMAVLLLGIGVAFIIPMLSATMQRESPERYRGRVMSAFAMANLGLRPLGALVAGVFASFAPVRLVTAGFAVLTVVGLIALRRMGRSMQSAAGIRPTALAADAGPPSPGPAS